MTDQINELQYFKRSADPASQEVLKYAKEKGYETIWDRAEKQKPICKFGATGICCRNCVMGPCRISPRAPVGICGATADTIVARNVIRAIAAGSAGHSDHGRHLALILKEIAEGKTNEYGITDVEKLKAVAKRLGIKDSNSINELAAAIAKIALDDFGSQDTLPLKFLEAYAPEKRKQRWHRLEETLAKKTGKKMGIIPRGIDREVADIMHRTHMGTDHDVMSLLMQGARVALADGWGGSLIATEIQDIIFGAPAMIQGMANLGVIDPDYINIIVHGHEPLLSSKIVEVAQTEEMQNLAKSVGTKGVAILGMCCTGNELLMRQGVAMAGNVLQQELAIITGAIEAIVVDVQCIYPALTTLAKCFHTKFISTSEQAAFPGGTHIQFEEDHASEVATKIIKMAIDAFPKRDKSKIYIPKHKSKATVGFGIEQIYRSFSGSLTPLLNALRDGTIKGIVAMMGCNTPQIKHDDNLTRLTKRLLSKGILVVGTGCSSIAAAKAGLMQDDAQKFASASLKKFCHQWHIPPVLHMGSCVDCSRILLLASLLSEHFDVDISKLPIVGSAPEWMSEKAFAIGTYFVASGINMHIWPLPPTTGSENVSHILTHEIEGLLGAKFLAEENPETSADLIENIILTKRKKLNFK